MRRIKSKDNKYIISDVPAVLHPSHGQETLVHSWPHRGEYVPEEDLGWISEEQCDQQVQIKINFQLNLSLH